MNVLAIIGIVIGGIVVAVVLFGLFSPRYVTMSRSTIINAEYDKVWNQLILQKEFVNNWSPWTGKDPNVKMEYTGVDGTVGAVYRWSGNKKIGKGSMAITAVVPGEKVVSRLRFEGMGEADVTLVLQSDSGKQKVEWIYTTDNGNRIMARIFGRFTDKFLGPDFESGLSKLKAYCES
ncbi:MAG: SRPBCC family protein [Flavobacteriales bacterium]